MDKPLVSMIVLEYNNFRYIFECIESIMSQDYPNIELIVNGDGADDFDEAVLIDYFRLNKSPNIQKILINNNEYNIGTVRCCNWCVKMSSGKYYMLIAADDALYDSSVISANVNYYESVPENSALAVGKILMMDAQLKGTLFTYPSAEDERLLQSLDSEGLFNVLVQRYFFGMTNMLPRSYFDAYGGYDEKYKLIEDIPFYAKALLRGTEMHYLGIPALKHRDGGISHGNDRYSSGAARAYITDCLTLFEREYLPNQHLLDDKARRVLKMRHVYTSYLYRYNCVFKMQSAAKRLYMVIRHPFWLLLMPPIAYSMRAKKHVLGAWFVVGIVLLLLYRFLIGRLPQVFDWAHLSIGLIGVLITLLAGALGGMKVVRKIILRR